MVSAVYLYSPFVVWKGQRGEEWAYDVLVGTFEHVVVLVVYWLDFYSWFWVLWYWLHVSLMLRHRICRVKILYVLLIIGILISWPGLTYLTLASLTWLRISKHLPLRVYIIPTLVLYQYLWKILLGPVPTSRPGQAIPRQLMERLVLDIDVLVNMHWAILSSATLLQSWRTW